MSTEPHSVPPPTSLTPHVATDPQPSQKAPSQTIGQVVSALPIGTGIALVSALVVVAGSLGPWVETVLGSVGGMRGDGAITLSAAVIAGVFAVLSGSRAGGAASAGVAILAASASALVGVVDLMNVRNEVDDVELFGEQLASAGWGLYSWSLGGQPWSSPV